MIQYTLLFRYRRPKSKDKSIGRAGRGRNYFQDTEDIQSGEIGKMKTQFTTNRPLSTSYPYQSMASFAPPVNENDEAPGFDNPTYVHVYRNDEEADVTSKPAIHVPEVEQKPPSQVSSAPNDSEFDDDNEKEANIRSKDAIPEPKEDQQPEIKQPPVLRDTKPETFIRPQKGRHISYVSVVASRTEDTMF